MLCPFGYILKTRCRTIAPLPHDCIVWHTNPFNQNFFFFYFPRDTIAPPLPRDCIAWQQTSNQHNIQ